MGKKNKVKQPNPKKEKYLKFRKDKPTNMTFVPTILSEEQMAQVKANEDQIAYFMRTRPRNVERFVNERKARSKR